jgi:uncharacterized protein (TIGR03435 family)
MRLSPYMKNMRDDAGTIYIRARKGLLAALPVIAVAAVLVIAPDTAKLNAQLIRAKDGVPPPAFDVASVKPNSSGSGASHIRSNDARYSIENVSLRTIIKIAYGVQSDAQITGGSGTILGNHYDIEAKIEDAQYAQIKGLSPADHRRQISLMIQALLAERFHLVVRFQTKRLPAYALIVAKGGPRFSPSVSAPSDHPGVTSRSNPQKAEATAHADIGLEGLTGLLASQLEMGRSSGCL